MHPLVHVPDPLRAAHLEDARAALALPVKESGLHWHPFGVYAIPLARRVADDGVWVRRLHLWHPDATPVGPASPYGVHTHSGKASSHVLVGALHHHLYAFRPEEDGQWLESSRDGRRHATLTDHVQGTTAAGMTHTFPAHHPHGVGKPPGFSVSLFEQREEGRAAPFTTWQRLGVAAEPLLDAGPVDVRTVRREALALVEEALYAVTGR